MENSQRLHDVSKEGAKNGEWVKIFMRKVHTLLEMEDNDDIKNYLNYLCIDLNYVEEQRNNLMSKHRDLVQELNTCKEQLLELKQAKLDFLTMRYVNTEILRENQNLRKELKELTAITETWLNSSNKVNHSGPKDLVLVKSSADDIKVSIPGVKRPWLSEAEGFILPNHDTADESSVCSTTLPPLEKLAGVEPVFGTKTIKSNLKSNSTFKAEALKGVIINEPSSAPAKGNKSASASKVNSAPAGKLKNVKIKDDRPLAICDIRKPIWYLDSRCSRHMTGVKNHLHKYVEQLGPKVVFGDDSTCTTEGYGSIKCNVYIHNHKDHLGKFNEKADDGYFLGYLLVSKTFKVFNTRRQQTKETYQITFDESLDAIKFTKPLVDNINIAESERYSPDEYLHPYEPSQRYQTNSNDVSFIEPNECPQPVALKTEVSSDQNGQTDQNDHNDQNDKSSQTDEILNDDQSEHPNHTNDEQIIDNLPSTKDIQISIHLSSPNVEDTSVHDKISIPPYPVHP
ncbi:hypothetical protein Tco_0487006 [Tanacetum coccineum]